MNGRHPSFFFFMICVTIRHAKLISVLKMASSVYTINVQITSDDGKCDFNFTHTCNTSEMASLARQFASLVASGGGGRLTASYGGAQSKEHKVGKKIAAGGFDCPSVVFARATKGAPKMDTEIHPMSQKTAGGSVSEHAAIFGEDDEEFEAAAADMQLGNFTPSAYDYANLRH